MDDTVRNHIRDLTAFTALAELGPVLAGERNFAEAAETMLSAVMNVAATREGVLFTYCEKPPQLCAAAWHGAALFPQNGYVPLLQRQVHALTYAELPESICGKGCDKFLSSSGNIAPELFKCVVPLRAAGKLAGAIALGARSEGAPYSAEVMQALASVANYVGLAVHNHNLAETLQQRVIENLKLLDSMTGFCDQTMEVFAAAIDAKEFRASGHSLRVGRYASTIGAAMQCSSSETAELRAAGYLHDIGKVSVDQRLFYKAAALEPSEFRQMADHTLVGHSIISAVPLPWPSIAGVVRWHHERCDGSGYPDHLREEQLALPVRIVAVADAFDAMIHERPYRAALSVGQALSDLVRGAPQKFDADVVHSLLTCVRSEACGHGPQFLDELAIANIGVADVDQLAADLKFKATNGRRYSA